MGVKLLWSKGVREEIEKEKRERRRGVSNRVIRSGLVAQTGRATGF